ncbi:hypothetical protein NIES4071_47920 [Calothrix sp. NIES-4071]|nr:hypothetical protein NIES4071_47920 [Calothrix sp. NIES-4071]BAZ59104.1 hypothetical protein NIES4105_47860 [Calothrix sp. NIES-4105]
MKFDSLSKYSMYNPFLALNSYCFRKYTTRSLLTVISLVLVVTNYGCTQKAQNEVKLEIKNLQPAGGNGVYKVAGSTNLPESSQVAITAVRYLSSNETQTVDADLDADRSILDRKIVEVKQGQWEADLNIWQVSPDGSYKETWQKNQLTSKQTPQNEVTFTVTFDPQSQVPRTQNQNSQTSVDSAPEFQSLEGKLLRFTNQGERYVQASQSISIPLPFGKTVPPQQLAEDVNDGWGNRYIIQPETVASTFTPPQVSKSRQTTAPLSTSEFLR